MLDVLTAPLRLLMTPEHDTTRLLTTAQVAARLGVSIRTLQRLIKQHDIRHDSVTRGQTRHKLYTASTVEYLRQQQAAPHDATDDATTDSHDALPTVRQPTDSQAATVVTMLMERNEALLLRALSAELELQRLRTLMAPTVDPVVAAPRQPWWRRLLGQ